MATVLLVDDHSFVAEIGARWLVELIPGLRALTATSAAEALAVARASSPDLVLLDVSLGSSNGFDLIGPLRAAPKSPAIVIFSGFFDEAIVRRAEKLRVAGLLAKTEIGGETLAVIVRKVLAGGTHVSTGLAGFLRGSQLVPVPPTVPAVVSRERIVVVKWDRFVAETIATAVRNACPAAEVHQCHSAAEARHLLKKCPADLGLFGLTLPDDDGLNLIPDVRRDQRVARILVVSDRRDEQTLHCLRNAAIDGFFDCGMGTVAELREAIRTVAAGGRWFGASTLKLLAVGRAGAPRLHDLLTPVELQVFAVIGDGSDNDRAGERLAMNSQTLQKHRAHVMHKLGVHTSGELVHAARRFGVVRFTAEGQPIYPGFAEELNVGIARRRAKREALPVSDSPSA